MENIFITPAALWKDFDPADNSLAANIIKEYELSGGYTVREYYFNGNRTEDGIIRGYGRFVFKDEKPKPAILILNGAGLTGDIEEYLIYLKEGYNIFLLDYSGDAAKGGRFTLYPKSRAFSNYNADNPPDIYKAPDGAMNTCWYDWAALSTRAVTLLVSFFEVKSSAIFVHGEKEGGAIAWMMAAIDKRIAGSIALFEAGWQNYNINKSEDADGTRAAWQAALSPQAYAQGINKPFLFLGASNEKGAQYDRINETFMRIPQNIPAYISIAPRLSGQLNLKNFNTALLFIKQCVTGENIFPKRPVIEAKASENKLYYGIKADNYGGIKKIKIFCAGGGSKSESRNWTPIPAEDVGEGEYIAKADIYKSDTYTYAFANIEYKNGILLSTATLARLPSALGINSAPPAKNRLFYDNSMKTDSFFAVSDGLINAGVTILDGPMGLSGVTAIDGALSTYKTNDIRYKGEENNSMQLTVYTKSPVTLTLTAEENSDGRIRRYCAKRQLNGTEFWQKITVPSNEFKSAEGTVLPGWDKIERLTIGGAGIVVNSILWV